MLHTDINILTADCDDFVINSNELSERLKTSRNYGSQAIEKCKAELLKKILYKCAYIRVNINLSEKEICEFGFMKIPSKDLFRNLNGCEEAFVMALTTGIAVDRYLAKLNIISQAEHFITDAIASAAIESFCDYVSCRLSDGLNCAPRFSPGYGDVDISFQEPLLKRLDADRTLGITLNDAYFMTPVKSITAIMGIRK